MILDQNTVSAPQMMQVLIDNGFIF
jgi:hypothetical protein